jgi:protein phosphatase
MNLTVTMASHPGKVRRKNEDNLYVNGMTLPHQNGGITVQSLRCDTAAPRLYGVFDGMGGYAAGERASYLAVETVNQQAASQLQVMPPDQLLPHLCMLANERICEEMLQGSNERIGTTASMLHFHHDRYTVCNVGDSPIYLLRNGALQCIHMEHSERANYERITGQQAPANKKFRLTQNIGIFTSEMLIEPYCNAGQIQVGDSFLICSDGLSDMVSQDAMLSILKQPISDQRKVDTLMQAALNNGGKDNITILLITVQASDSVLPVAAPKAKTPWVAIVISAVSILVALFSLLFVMRCFRLHGQPTDTQSETTAATEPETTATTEPGNPTETTPVGETTVTTDPSETNTEPPEGETPSKENNDSEGGSQAGKSDEDLDPPPDPDGLE